MQKFILLLSTHRLPAGKTTVESIKLLIESSDKFNFCFSVAKNDEKRALVHVNQKFSQETGYQQDEVVGRNCKFLQGVNTEYLHVKNIKNSLDNQEATFQELVNYTKSGSEFVNRLILLPFGEYILGFQNRMPIKENLISINDVSIDQFDINHHINNPLMIIINAMYLEHNSSEKIKTSIEKIHAFIMDL